MELEHSFNVAAPVPQAWAVLQDIERIAPCLPGATLTSFQGDEFTGTVRVKLGPVVLTFAGRGRFQQRDEAARRLVIEASGADRRGGGTARATVRAALRDDRGSTTVDVHTDLVVTGRAAQFGRGMLGEVSNRLLGQFTECLAGRLADAPAQPSAVAEPVDLLAVTGVRATAARALPYLLAFLAGALLGGGLVALLMG